MSDGTRKRLLITGASGIVGTALRTHLKGRYDFRLLFHRATAAAAPGDQVVVGDVANFEAMLEASAGVDGIVHLARLADRPGLTRAEWAQQALHTDMPGVYNIYEAARLNRVPTVVFASTNHVTGLDEEDGIVSRPDGPVRPDGIYGAGKAFGEALGRYYAERLGVRVFCLRIANCNAKDAPHRAFAPGRSRWVSQQDLAQLVWRCIESDLRFGIFYGVSGGAEKKWDISNARALLGYEPQDDGTLEHWHAAPPNALGVPSAQSALGAR
jgi:nucleoside-diphosphate-sugar epimerase